MYPLLPMWENGIVRGGALDHLATLFSSALSGVFIPATLCLNMQRRVLMAGDVR